MGDLLHMEMMCHALHTNNMTSTNMMSDLSLPHDTVEDFISFVVTNLGIWSLWFCLLPTMKPPTLPPCSMNLKTKLPPLKFNVDVWDAVFTIWIRLFSKTGSSKHN